MSALSFNNIYLDGDEASLKCEGGKFLVETKIKRATVTVKGSEINHSEWIQHGTSCCLHVYLRSGKFYNLSSFRPTDRKNLFDFMSTEMNTEPKEINPSISGSSMGDIIYNDYSMTFESEHKPVFSVPYSKINDSQKSSKNDFFVTLDGNPNAIGEQLHTIRFFVPTNYNKTVEDMIDNIQKRTDLTAGTDDYIAQINNIKFVTPRQKNASLRFCETILYLKAEGFEHRIPYKQIFAVHCFETYNDSEYVVISLQRALKQGQSEYLHLVIEIDEDDDLKIEPIEKSWTVSEAIINLFEQAANIKVVPSSNFFLSSANKHGVKCLYKTSNGTLFITHQGFFFLHKAKYIPFSKVKSVKFQKLDKNLSSIKVFDLLVTEKSDQTFVGIGINDAELILHYLKSKSVNILDYEKIKKDLGMLSDGGDRRRIAREKAMEQVHKNTKFLGPDSSDDEEEDEDFNPNKESSSEDEGKAVESSESSGEKKEESDGSDE